MTAIVSYCIAANSNLFKISQGVGLEGVLSVLMFLVYMYINDLLYEICQGNNSLVLYDSSIDIPCILLTDVTALKSYSPRCLQSFL